MKPVIFWPLYAAVLFLGYLNHPIAFDWSSVVMLALLGLLMGWLLSPSKSDTTTANNSASRQ